MYVLASGTDTDNEYGDNAPPIETGTIYEVLKCPRCNGIVLVSGFWHDGMEPEDWSGAVLLPKLRDKSAREVLAAHELDVKCMQLALDEARKSVAEKLNQPLVGAVVATRDGFLEQAHRSEFKAGEHAEFTLLEGKCKDSVLTGATVYTTLEPCTHRNHPKTPCADRLIRRKVSRVVVGMLDPDERIRGLGILALRRANVRVDLFPPNLMAELEELNRDFIADRERRVEQAS